jgi:hypothetical protein
MMDRAIFIVYYSRDERLKVNYQVHKFAICYKGLQKKKKRVNMFVKNMSIVKKVIKNTFENDV